MDLFQFVIVFIFVCGKRSWAEFLVHDGKKFFWNSCSCGAANEVKKADFR